MRPWAPLQVRIDALDGTTETSIDIAIPAKFRRV
jgi:hypothetical protein